MFAFVNINSVLLVILCSFTVNSAKLKKTRYGPSGMSFDSSTNCSEFSKFGRFNPYSVLHEKWFVFFYWAAPQPLTTYVFTFPTANHTKHLKKILDGNTVLPVMWSARQILMENQKGEISLLVERADRGEYWQYPIYKVSGAHKITPRDVRLKQTGDNKLIGFMNCFDETMFALARMNDVPPKNRLAEEAARLGFRGRRGKSYLYQGHEWVPIPEDDEKKYWEYPKKKKEQKDSSNEVQRSNEEESGETNEPKKAEQNEIPDNDNQLYSEDHVEPNCIKIEPELWNDPKPNPTNTENKMLSIEDLNTLDVNETIAKSNTSLIESRSLTSDKTEEIPETDGENVNNIENNDITVTEDEQKVIVNLEKKEVGENAAKDGKTEDNLAKDEQEKQEKVENMKGDDQKADDERKNYENAKDKETANEKVEGKTKEAKKSEDKRTKYEQVKDKKAEHQKKYDKKMEEWKAKEKKAKSKKVRENKIIEEENCDICYDSSPSMYSTPEPYKPHDGPPYKKTDKGYVKNFESPQSKTNEKMTKASQKKASKTQDHEEETITISTMTIDKSQL